MIRERFLVAVFLFFALRATTGTASAGPDGLAEAGVYALDSSGSILPISPYPGNVSSTYSVGAYPLAPAPLARGSGQELVEGYCSVCHSVTLIAGQPRLPPALWKKEVDKMIHLGAMIPPEVVGQIVDYLQKHYSPLESAPAPPTPAAGP